MGGFSKHQITTAAEVLKLDEARKALRHIARAEGFYEQAEQKYDPNNLPLMAKNVRMLRKMRDITDEQLPSEIEEFIMAKPEVVQVAMPASRMERYGFVAAIISAVVLAPFAVLAAFLALSNPEFTGFANKPFPIAMAEHIVYVATQAELMGYVAAASMLLTFSMSNKVMLRLCAIIANIFFISYGIGATLVPVVMLHMILLPINVGHLSRALHNQGARTWAKDPVPVKVKVH